MSDLRSAAIPPLAPADHVRGSGPEAIVYIDLACPSCAQLWAAIVELPLRLCVRHFPLAGRRPRAPVLHAAVEAAAEQGGEEAFWGFWDSLLADQARSDDPHLWQRAERLGLELEGFERARRSDAVAARIELDFRAGIRVGITATPSAFVAGEQLGPEPVAELRRLAGQAHR